MKWTLVAATICVIVGLPAASAQTKPRPSPQTLILGTWVDKYGTEKLTFYKGGVFNLTGSSYLVGISGDYQFVDRDAIKLKGNGVTDLFTITELTPTHLSFTRMDGSKHDLTRVGKPSAAATRLASAEHSRATSTTAEKTERQRRLLAGKAVAAELLIAVEANNWSRAETYFDGTAAVRQRVVQECRQAHKRLNGCNVITWGLVQPTDPQLVLVGIINNHGSVGTVTVNVQRRKITALVLEDSE